MVDRYDFCRPGLRAAYTASGQGGAGVPEQGDPFGPNIRPHSGHVHCLTVSALRDWNGATFFEGLSPVTPASRPRHQTTPANVNSGRLGLLSSCTTGCVQEGLDPVLPLPLQGPGKFRTHPEDGREGDTYTEAPGRSIFFWENTGKLFLRGSAGPDIAGCGGSGGLATRERSLKRLNLLRFSHAPGVPGGRPWRCSWPRRR